MKAMRMTATEAKAHRRYNNGDLGFYVVNERTDVAVAGPLKTEIAAINEAVRRNNEEPVSGDRLIVWEIVR